MKLSDYGKLVKSDPAAMRGRDAEEIEYIRSLPDEVVALAHLEDHPARWSLISPTIQRQRALINQSTDPNAWFKFLRSQENLNEKRRDNIDTIAHEIRMLHEADMIAKASMNNIPIEVAGQVAVIEAEAEAVIRVMEKKHELQVKALEEKLRFAALERQLKMGHSPDQPAGDSDGREQPREIRQRNVSTANRKKLGRLQQAADTR